LDDVLLGRYISASVNMRAEQEDRLESDGVGKCPEAAPPSVERPRRTSGNVLSQAELRTPVVNYSASGGSLNVEVKDNVSVLSLNGILRQAVERSIVRPAPPPVETLSQVIADPRYTALYDANGTIIPESSLYSMPLNAPDTIRNKFRNSLEMQEFEPESINISELEACDETVVFGGAPHPHFGHHLVDGMSRLWYHSDRPTLYVNALSQARGDHSFISEYLALGRPRTFYNLEKPTLFAKVILPHAAIQNAFLIYDNADTEHLAIMQSALEKVPRRVPPKVYLSRRSVPDRKCHGEEELERRLSLHGFAIVSPETLPVVDQISIFNCADWVVGLTGSAFHNVLFTRRGGSTRTVQITAKKPNLRFLMIDRIKGQTSYYLRTAADEKVIGSKIITSRVDVEDTMSALQAIGAL
jgi:hypothetical protein